MRRSFAATRIFIKDDDRLPATEFFRGSTLLKNCSKCFSNCDHFFLFRIGVRWNAIGLVLNEKARMKRVEVLEAGGASGGRGDAGESLFDVPIDQHEFKAAGGVYFTRLRL